MKLKQISSYELDKCYAIAPLKYNSKNHILIAAEKTDKCMLFDTDGNYEDTIWDQPGGTMSMVQVPNSDGVFLATHKFYSPNDSKEAKIVLVSPNKDGKWEIKTIKELPFVHRFNIVNRGGIDYIIACTLKSDHEYKEDWRYPGKIYVCELPSDLSKYDENNQLEMEVIKDGLLKNHGYCTVHTKDGDYSLIGSDNGIFKVVPPNQKGGKWCVEQLTDEPTSDMAIADFDNDGEDEIIAIMSFHGEEVKIYKQVEDKYKQVYKCDFKLEFAHSIFAGKIFDKNVAIIGHRQGKRDIVEFYYDNGYKTNVLMEDVGSTNIYLFKENGKEKMISTNREINQIAFYEIERD